MQATGQCVEQIEPPRTRSAPRKSEKAFGRQAAARHGNKWRKKIELTPTRVQFISTTTTQLSKFKKRGPIVMKSFGCWSLLALVATTLSAAAVVAQDQGRGQGSRLGGESANDPSYLLRSESVQKELALTDDQTSRLNDFWDEEEKNGSNFFRGFIGLSQEQIQKKLENRAKATRKKISKILTPQQMDRLNEIYIQKTGIAALSFVDIAKKMELTAEQRDELQKLGDESRRKLANLYSTNNGPPPDAAGQPERKKKQIEIATERLDKSIALLTDEQKAKFEKLQGEKFDISTIKPLQRSYANRGRIDAPPAVPIVQ
jgi:Spy/CpxP family protein refolding chaperone